MGNGALIQGDVLAIAQGNDVNGNASTSDRLYDTAQQVYLSLDGLLDVDQDDLLGVLDLDVSATVSEIDDAVIDAFNPVSVRQGEVLYDLFSKSLDSILTADEFRERNNLAVLAYRAYTGKALLPASLANLSAGVLGQGECVSALVDVITKSEPYEDSVSEFFGGDLKDLPTDEIVSKVYSVLYDRNPSDAELMVFAQQVNLGVCKSDLPMLILRSTSGLDLYRTALLSAADQWAIAQWGTSANVDGSFSQGFQPAREQFDDLGGLIAGVGSLESWGQAQEEFNHFQDSSLQDLIGTPVSKQGAF